MVRALALGFLVGFPIAASPGPMFFLVVRRTFARGWRNGFISGLGIATGDAAYAALAAFGVTAVTSVLIGERRWIGLAGGVAIALIGLRAVLRRQSPRPGPPRKGEGKSGHKREGDKKGHGGAYLSILLLTLGNPPTILSFMAVFAGLGVRVGSGWRPAAALVVGVMLGSALWWMVLTLVVSVVRERLTPAITRSIGVASGFVLVAFGVLITLQSL
jgi:threonine/homoserine/homoserine lactone efflux protein